MKYLFQEVNLNKKKEKIINIYENIIKENNYKSKDILFLVPSAITKLSYMREINLPLSEELKITTYNHFVQSELIKYWPIIEENCEKIKVNKISPSFISQSLSEYIIMEYINKTREEENYFQDIVGTNKSICKNILDNLSKSCFNAIDINNIGEKIYNSKKNRNDLSRYSYTQMQEVIDFYVNTLLSKGIIDNSIAVYLYNNFLLNNEEYRRRLRKEYRYLIVDSLESASVSESNLILEFLNIVEDGYVFYDRSKDYSSFKNVDMAYIEENIINEFFKEDVHDLGIISIKSLYKEKKSIELKDEYHLYDEMIDGVVEKLLQLMREGKNLKDIAIISPINNSILDYKICNKLKSNKIAVTNTKLDNKIVDYPYANVLVVATCIFYNLQYLIKEEEYINFIEILFDINKIRAIKIFNHRHDNEEYKSLIEFIKDKEKENLRISEFLLQFYIEKMLNLKDGKKNVDLCKDMIKQGDIFSEILEELNMDEKEKYEVFVKCLKDNISDYYMSADIEDMKSSNKVIITTPYTYISANINRKIQLWLDVGSNAWNMKIEKDIANPLVLRKSFDEKLIYSDEMEDKNKRYYLYNLIYNLLLNSEEVYAFKSEYSVNGFMQESMLYGLLLKLLDKGEITNE
ncbi:MULTISPECIES: hypothetical protein [Terrisporobacter]|uniref:Uncharacterized protein n=2 Tax=Terrisporobacter TaxID=1505652 RepID=A0A0B3WSL1_9FIRM|nr:MULTISPECIES: hypothetical protein [Terrisporobacter]KHS57550.1 hypothetical protein QX51_07705 [Terrisporobacter othiniensis]MCC3669530.1 hypothetical protein [Terrisporobacter mayombei]MDY3374324.1 hypothetical protein [Terrisporobacter othiniensis]